MLVVATAGLGTLNHTELTVAELRRRGLTCVGVVVGAWPADPDLAARCNLVDLPAVTGVPLLGAVAAGAGGLDPGRVRQYRASRTGLFARWHVADSRAVTTTSFEILDIARDQVLERGEGLSEEQVLEVLRLPDEALDPLLQLAHEVRMRWCGPEVEVEGIVSLKTGGCPEDCHFCSQSGLFESPVRAAWLDIPMLVEAAKQTAKTGATEFCIVAAVRGPDEKLMAQVAAGIAAIKDEVDINIACSLGMLTPEQVDALAAMGVHRYNHNLETARSYFPNVVTTHTWEERFETLRLVREAGMEVCCGGIIGLGETVEQRAELAGQLAAVEPDEVPLNFLNPRPGTPLADREPLDGADALRTVAAFRLAMPRTVLRFAGGREITLGDLGARQGLLGGINAVIVGNYLTTLGRPAESDIDLLGELQMPIKALNETL